MNYEEARQIGKDGPAPGKWNWTNMNDSVQPNPYTIAPCAWPDFEWPPYDYTRSLQDQPKVTPTGRERCDHDTREEAERHHWEANVAAVTIRRVDLKTARSRSKCDVPGCDNWERYQAQWPDGYIVDSLCARHGGPDRVEGNPVELIHPFVPGTRIVHS